MTSRYKWKQVLPTIQAFVDGKEIQKLDYGKRWKDTDSMMDVMHSTYRVKPEQSIKGTWTITFHHTPHGTVDGPTSIGVMSWKGNGDEVPPWPVGREYQYDLNTQKFTPDDKIDVNEEEILED